MTKNELIATVAGKASMTKTAAASAVDATFDAITAALKKGGEVKIMGFGHFRVVKRAAREGRNPRTGKPVKIKAARRPRFSAGKALKDAVNRLRTPTRFSCACGIRARGGVCACPMIVDGAGRVTGFVRRRRAR